MQYWKVAKLANQLYDDWDKIKGNEKHSQNYKDQILKDAHQNRKESEEKLLVYKSIVKRANEFKRYYCEQMSQLLKRLEEHEVERIQSLKAAADKIIVYETSYEMNNKYDAKAFVKVSESINEDRQIKFFKSKVNLMKTYDQKDLQIPVSPTPSNQHSKHQIFGIPQKQLSHKTDDSLDEDMQIEMLGGRLSNQSLTTKLTDPVSRKLSDDMEGFLREAIFNCQATNEDVLKQFKSMIETNSGRIIYMKKLNIFRTNQQCALQSRENYNNLCKIMMIMLDECHKQMDVQCAMKTLVFSNNFYIENKEAGQRPRDYLQNGISQHEIWKDFKFWERAIYEQIQCELSEQKNYVELDKNNVTKQIVFAQLCSLQHEMLCFDLDKEKIKDLIQIFCHNYKLIQKDITDLNTRLVNFGIFEGDSTPKENYSNYASGQIQSEAKRGVPQWLKEIENYDVNPFDVQSNNLQRPRDQMSSSMSFNDSSQLGISLGNTTANLSMTQQKSSESSKISKNPSNAHLLNPNIKSSSGVNNTKEFSEQRIQLPQTLMKRGVSMGSGQKTQNFIYQKP
ncbi:UNKNOWN [Stylonychia lemnae]|uniref:SBF1/SBF2 domain-containing protein n=1 Tax=Stylonychia lemnae TaxID=5949 RepID=A0A077ZU19_STYLE|nr:UNKNOWN [Stylonychia lemnae]|eukprot:CDW73398.1 UNKNOWN [Stylonychia lemnae]